MRNVAYLSPILLASLYSRELYAFIASSKLSKWFIETNLGAAPSIDTVLFPRAKALNPEPVASAFVASGTNSFHKSFPVRCRFPQRRTRVALLGHETLE